MAAWCIAARWRSSPRDERCSTGCSASAWTRTNERAGQAPTSAPRCRRRARDYLPLLLPLALALAALPFIPSASTWVTLTIAGLAMGMMIFVMASGLTLIFGLMDVLNFGHGAFIAIGAYMATLVLLPLAGWMQADFDLAQSRGRRPGGCCSRSA